MEAMKIIVLTVALLLMPCALGIFQRRFLAVNEALFRMVLSPIAVAETSLQQMWQRIGQLYGQQLIGEDGRLDARLVFYEVIGSILYTICFVLSSYADFHLICMTLAAMGIEADFMEPPGGPGTVTGLALISGVLFFGTMLLDLIGMTHIAPWQKRLTPHWKKIMLILCGVSLVVSIFTAALCGYWRGMAITDYTADSAVAADVMLDGGGLMGLNGTLESSLAATPPESTSALDVWVPVVVNINIPLLMIAGGCLSGYGVVQFIKFAVLGSVFILFLPTFLLMIVLRYLARIIEHVFSLVVSLMELVAEMGLWFMGLFNYHPETRDDSEPTRESRRTTEVENDPDDDEPFINPYENRKESSDE